MGTLAGNGLTQLRLVLDVVLMSSLLNLNKYFPTGQSTNSNSKSFNVKTQSTIRSKK